MKKTTLVLFMCIVAFLGCQKKEVSVDNTGSNKADNLSEESINISETGEPIINAEVPAKDGIFMSDENSQPAALDDNSAFFSYIEKGDTANLEKLISSGFDINSAEKNGVTPVYLAVLLQKYNVLELLIEKGADVNAATVDGMLPLSQAIVQYDDKAFDILINKGKADFYYVPDGFWVGNPIYTAVYEGNSYMIDKMVAAGVDLNHDFSKYRATPLMIYAVKNKNGIKSNDYKEIIATLLLNKVNINQQDIEGNTPLIYAVLDQNINAFNALIVSQADTSIKNHKGETALDIAKNMQKAYGGRAPESLNKMIEFLTPAK